MRSSRLLAAAALATGLVATTAGSVDAAGVSYTDPPPPLPLTAFATVARPEGMDGPFGVAAAESGATVVFGSDTSSTAFYAGYDGAVSAPVPLAARIFSVTPGPGGVVYGITMGEQPPVSGASIVAIAMGGPRLGQVVASEALDSVNLEPSTVEYVNTSAGIVRASGGAPLIRQVDQLGAPLDVSFLPDRPLVQTNTVIIDPSTPDAWDISIERDPGYKPPYTGEEPPTRSVAGAAVWSTSIGPSADPDGEFGSPTQPVLAVLRPGERAEWFSVADGWIFAGSDVWGTVFVRETAGGAIELARLDPALLGDEAGGCASYEEHDSHTYPFRRCDSGAFVTAIQGLLRYDHGYAINVDGYYGPSTEAAVRDFQASHGLEVDGLTGRRTWAALIAPYAGDPMRTDTDGSGLVDPWEFGDPHSAATETQAADAPS